MKTLLVTLMAALALMLGAQHATAMQSVYIPNASFEAPASTPDFTYIIIPGWNSNRVSVGVASGGFADNGQRPDKAQVAFLRTPNNAVNINQMLTGLDTTKKYCLQFWHNSYSGSGAITNACQFDVALVGASLPTGQIILGGYTNNAVGGSNPYNYQYIVFTPTTNEVQLRFRNLYWGSLVDSVLLLDGITLFQLGHSSAVPEVIVKNPSFEASGYQGPGGGVGFINVTAGWSPINDVMAGWTYYDGGYNNATFGTGTNNNPYFWIVPVPEGQNAFFDNKSEQFYAASSKQTMLKQTIDGLQNNQGYYISFNYSARPGAGNVYSPSNFTAKIGGIELMRDDLIEWDWTYYSTTLTFIANATSMDLVFGTSNSVNGSTMMVDDVSIWPIPEPLALSALGLGLVAWLAGRRAR
ncbi:MAG: hypothetical protein NTV22_08980 [bacterium]|nr:hypothetical protein [bacterium]